MRRVATPVAITAGMPYSHATIELWLRGPPMSVTTAEAIAKRGVQAGDIADNNRALSPKAARSAYESKIEKVIRRHLILLGTTPLPCLYSLYTCHAGITFAIDWNLEQQGNQCFIFAKAAPARRIAGSSNLLTASQSGKPGVSTFNCGASAVGPINIHDGAWTVHATRTQSSSRCNRSS